MDENNVVTQETVSVDDMSNDELKIAVEEQMQRIRRQSIFIGAQSICKVILDKIYKHNMKPGNKSYRDYERLIKDISAFCETGMSRKINDDGTVSVVEDIKDTSDHD